MSATVEPVRVTVEVLSGPTIVDMTRVPVPQTEMYVVVFVKDPPEGLEGGVQPMVVRDGADHLPVVGEILVVLYYEDYYGFRRGQSADSHDESIGRLSYCKSE